MTQDVAIYEGGQQGMALDMVRPLVSAGNAAQAIREYEALKAAIVRPSDVQKNQGRTFLKKAFWRRLATCFGLTCELLREERGHDEGGHLYYSVVYRATAPNGRTMDGDGYCSTAEPGRASWTEHNVRATAHTRAKNRAISDMVGGGEVSAEEMPDEDEAPQRAPVRALPANRPAVPSEPSEPSGPAVNLKGLVNTLLLRCNALGMTVEEREDLCVEVNGHTGIKSRDEYLRVAERVTLLERDQRTAGANRAAAERVPADALEGVETGAPA